MLTEMSEMSVRIIEMESTKIGQEEEGKIISVLVKS
jgi:hypothetical protein